MDVIEIPRVSGDSSVEQSLERCRQGERSGVVFSGVDGSHRLLHAGDLLRARAAQVTRVGEVPGGADVLVLDPLRAKRFRLDLSSPHDSWQQYDRMFDVEGVDYGVLPSTKDGFATIVTHHETQSMNLGMNGGYECTGSPRHYYPIPRVNVGETCPQSFECGPTSTIQQAN